MLRKNSKYWPSTSFPLLNPLIIDYSRTVRFTASAAFYCNAYYSARTHARYETTVKLTIPRLFRLNPQDFRRADETGTLIHFLDLKGLSLVQSEGYMVLDGGLKSLMVLVGGLKELFSRARSIHQQNQRQAPKHLKGSNTSARAWI